jgi:hypothetical protein
VMRSEIKKGLSHRAHSGSHSSLLCVSNINQALYSFAFRHGITTYLPRVSSPHVSNGSLGRQESPYLTCGLLTRRDYDYVDHG